MKNNFNIAEVKKHWESVANIYDKENSYKLNPHHWRFIEGIKHVNSSNSKNIKILSLWSRTGNAIPYIRKKMPNAKLYNLETSTKMIKIAKKAYPNEVFMETDLETLDFKDNSFDYIMSHETLEHTPYPDRLIKEFYRVLKPDGRLVLSLPPRIADMHQLIYETFIGGHGEGPRKGIPSWVVKRILRKTGFYLKAHKAILLLPIGPLWFIKLGNKITEWLPFLKEFGIMQFYICNK